MADDAGEMAGLVEPRLVKIRAGKRGAGWAVGTRGVLTARHVVAPFLEGRERFCLAVPAPRQGAPEFDCTVVWQDEARDLALLAVDEKQMASWAAAVGEDTGPHLAEPGTAPLDVEAVGYPNAAVEKDFPHPEQVPGMLLPAGGAISGLMPLDVDGSVPEGSALWQGMSGAGVRDRATGRLVGVVVKAGEARQQRRLYVRPLPDPARDSGFAAALATVGARPVLEASNAPTVQRLLTVWDETGRPYLVGQVPELSLFGARKARTDVDTHGNTYYPYVRRGLDEDLAAALDRRVDGTDRRMLLLVGDAMSGKSRTGAHALMTHPVLSTRALLVPSKGAPLREVADLAPATGAVLWLDDLNTFVAGLDPGVVRYWQAHPGLVVVATLRSELLGSFLDDPELRPAWAVVDDNTIVERHPLPGEWSDEDQQELDGVEPVIRNKVAHGLTLGEVLGAAEELQKRLAHAEPFIRKAVTFVAIDWVRIGMTEGIPEALVEQLWPSYLSRKDVLILNNKDPGERHDDVVKALQWAKAPIPGTASMLVTQIEGRLRAEDYLIAQPLQNEIPRSVWNMALGHSTAGATPAKTDALAHNAFTFGVYDVAQRAWEMLAASSTTEAPMASRNLGLLLNLMGNPAGAKAALQAAIDSGDHDAAPLASISMGRLLEEQGDPAGARAAYQAAMDSGHPDHAPSAALRLGALLEGQGDPAGARTAYLAAKVSVRHLGQASISLGRLLEGQGDPAGARTAYQLVAFLNITDYAPMAWVHLGLLREGQGDPAGARTAYQAAMDSDHVESASWAATNLGLLLERQGDQAGARTAYQAAIDSGHVEYAPSAAISMGLLLERQGDQAGARTAYQAAIDSGHVEYAPSAAISMGLLLERQGDQAGARTAYQAAIDSGHAEHAPRAAVNLGLLLEGQGDPAGARTAYQTAIDSGHEGVAPVAELLVGEYCTDGDLQARLDHRNRAAASGNPEVLLSIAELYLADREVPAATQLLLKAARAGSTVAADCLQLFPQDATDSVDDHALRAVLASAEAGNTDSMNMLGLHAAEGGDLDHARSWWTRSAAQNDVIAPLLLSPRSQAGRKRGKTEAPATPATTDFG